MTATSMEMGALAASENAGARSARIIPIIKALTAAALVLTATACNGILVNSTTGDLTGLGRAFVRVSNLTDSVGMTEPVSLIELETEEGEAEEAAHAR